MKKKALFTSVMTIVLCISLIAGSTFALFTSESKVNIAVTAGNVEVIATISDVSLYSPSAINMDGTVSDAENAVPAGDMNFVNGGSAELNGGTLTLTKVTPGDKVNFKINIENKSNVTIVYRTSIACTDDQGLFSGLKFNIGGKDVVSKSKWVELAAGADIASLDCWVELPADAGNDYQETSCTVTFTVEAVQGNADMPDWYDGHTVANPQLDEDGKYHITNAAEFYSFVSGDFKINAGNTVVLDCNVDLGGATVKGYDNSVFDSNFDGQGHTVSNFTVMTTYFDNEHYCGLFPYISAGCYVKNLTVKDAAAIAPEGVGMVGMIAGAAYGATVENCHVENCIVIGAKKVGAVVGYIDTDTTNNCSATDCTVYCANADEGQSGEVVGYQDNCTATNISATNVTVIRGVTASAYVGGNVNLAANETVAYVADATVTVDVSENYHRIYSDNAVFVNCKFEGTGYLWIKDTATFIDCTFNTEIHDAEPVVGTVTFENCTFNKGVHFAPASTGADTTGKFLVANGCKFNANLTVSGFEKVTLKDCALSGNNWAGKNMISYSPLAIDNCTFTAGIRLSYSDTSMVTCTNGTVDLSWENGSATVGSN